MRQMLVRSRVAVLMVSGWLGIATRGAPADSAPARPTYPPARREDATETHHGVSVKDPYRWLEDLDSEETRRWIDAEDALLDAYVAPVPEKARMRQRLLELGRQEFSLTPIKAGGRYFSMTTPAAGNPTGLSVRESVESAPRLLLDPAKRFPGGDVALNSFAPSPDGRFVAFTTSTQQSRWLQVHVLETAAGTDRPIPDLRVHSMDSTLTWTPGGESFYYTRFEQPPGSAERTATPVHPTIRLHRLSDGSDTLAYTPPDEPGLLLGHQLSDDGWYLVVTLRDASSSKTRIVYLNRRRGGPATTLIPVADANFTFLGSEDRRFFVFTDWRAPRGRVVAVDLDAPDRGQWREVIREAGEPVAASSAVGGNALGMYGGRFVLMYLKDGRAVLRVFDKRGRLVYEPELPAGGLIWGGFSGAQRDPEVLYRFLGLTHPGTIYRLDVEKKQNRILQGPAALFPQNAVQIEQVFYQSKDGTRVPMFLAHKKGWKKGDASPAYMYGYGAFGWIAFLWYQPFVLNWLELGGIYAQPGLRGGGEYGEPWHEAGAKRNKQNVVDDYIAAAEWLVANGYASQRRLVANGGSASGGIAAAAILQRPDLFGAAVIDIPVLDMLRFDRFSQGSVWLPEFGSPRDPDDFRALHAWSPYHNIRDGRCYPPMLVNAGERDQVAIPLHAYKFAAAMQAAQGCANPILLNVIRGAGHSLGATPEQTADSLAEETAFLMRVLSMPRSSSP